LGIALTLGIDLIMQLWVGQAFPDQGLVVAAMAASATIIAVTAPYNMVLNAAGKVGCPDLGLGGFVAVSVLGKFLLIPVFGAWFVSVITLIAYAICVTPAMIISALRLTGSRSR